MIGVNSGGGTYASRAHEFVTTIVCFFILFALSVHRLLITVLHCLSTIFWLPFCIVCPPSSDYLLHCLSTAFLLPFCICCPPHSHYLFALSVHRLLITFLHCLSTAFWLPFCIVCPPSSDYLYGIFKIVLITLITKDY